MTIRIISHTILAVLGGVVSTGSFVGSRDGHEEQLILDVYSDLHDEDGLCPLLATVVAPFDVAAKALESGLRPGTSITALGRLTIPPPPPDDGEQHPRLVLHATTLELLGADGQAEVA